MQQAENDKCSDSQPKQYWTAILQVKRPNGIHKQ